MEGALTIEIAPLLDAPGTSTSFRVRGVGTQAWEVTGGTGATVVSDGADLEVTAPVVAGAFEIRPVG